MPYTATGVASRDNVRKMFWEIFENEPDMNQAVFTNKEIVDQLETVLFESTGADAKTREYREKTNNIKLKLKGPSYQETRNQIRMGELTVDHICSDEFINAKAAPATRPGSSIGMGASRGRGVPPIATLGRGRGVPPIGIGRGRGVLPAAGNLTARQMPTRPMLSSRGPAADTQ